MPVMHRPVNYMGKLNTVAAVQDADPHIVQKHAGEASTAKVQCIYGASFMQPMDIVPFDLTIFSVPLLTSRPAAAASSSLTHLKKEVQELHEMHTVEEEACTHVEEEKKSVEGGAKAELKALVECLPAARVTKCDQPYIQAIDVDALCRCDAPRKPTGHSTGVMFFMWGASASKYIVKLDKHMPAPFNPQHVEVEGTEDEDMEIEKIEDAAIKNAAMEIED
ncbi:hypothetical protein EW146_g8462 [Bondarzewia mesenterica]|uniref:Uncharacterized protein n=1 Tax=Bondarzewia mesenterica TaxID=1095465 RepID=A0A4S4LEN7_9AGAM|nr:hypothetical protein EW146_g8462 [Bondarzewia mesenterica]